MAKVIYNLRTGGAAVIGMSDSEGAKIRQMIIERLATKALPESFDKFHPEAVIWENGVYKVQMSCE